MVPVSTEARSDTAKRISVGHLVARALKEEGIKAVFIGSHPDLSVPYREVLLSTTHHSDRAEHNAPVPLYDTSGSSTDPDARIDLNNGLPPLRAAWSKTGKTLRNSSAQVLNMPVYATISKRAAFTAMTTSSTRMTVSQRAQAKRVECDVVCSGRFHDLLEKQNGRWSLPLRQPTYEKDIFTPVNSSEVVKLDETKLAHFPIRYRHLAYVQELAGYKIKRDGRRMDQIGRLRKRTHAGN